MVKIYTFLQCIPILLLEVFVLTSCTQEERNEYIPPVGDGEVTFTMQLPISYDIQTRSAGLPDENIVSSIYVLAFDQNNGGKLAHKIEGYEQEVIESEKYSKLKFKIRIPVGTYDLMLVTNIEKSEMNDLEIGETLFSNAYGILEKACPNTSGDNKWVVDNSDNINNRIIMWGEEKNFSLLSKVDVKMTRMLAKVAVINEDEKFVLNEVRFCNYNLTGRIAPASDRGMNIPGNPNKQYGPDKALEYKGYKGEAIYVAETKSKGEYKENEKDEDSWMGNPCVLIKGSYDGKPDSWYRLNIIDKSSWMDIKRNHAYTFTIKKISDKGYATAKEAFENAPVNMDGEVGDWNNLNLEGGIIIGSSDLYFFASSTTFDFECEAYNDWNNLAINNMTVEFTGKKLEITPKSNIIEITGDVNTPYTGGTEWLTIKVTQTGTPRDDVYDFTILFEFDENTTGAKRTAQFEMMAGKTTLLVTVNQDYMREVKVTTSQTSIPAQGLLNIPVRVENHRQNVYIRALFGNEVDGPKPVLVGTEYSEELKCTFNGTGVERTLTLEWSYDQENWQNIGNIPQEPDARLLSSGMYVAKEDFAKTIYWAQAVGVGTGSNSILDNTITANYNYDRTALTGCFLFSSSDVPNSEWWLPNEADLKELISRENIGIVKETATVLANMLGYMSTGQPAAGTVRKYAIDKNSTAHELTHAKNKASRVRCVTKVTPWPLVE